MPKRTKKARKTVTVATATAAPVRVQVQRLLVRDCLKGSPLYPQMHREGLQCGCRVCFPNGWCAFADAAGNKCVHERCFIYEAALYPYCWEHYRRVILQKGLETVGEILKRAQQEGNHA